MSTVSLVPSLPSAVVSALAVPAPRPTGPVLSIFDTETTVLYKWAALLQVPIRLLVPTIGLQGTLTYQSLQTFVQERLSNYSLLEIYQQLQGLNSNITYEDVAMTYVLIKSLEETRGQQAPLGGFSTYLPSLVLDRLNEFFLSVGKKENVLTSFQALDGAYQAWSSRFQMDYRQDMETAQSIIETQQKLQSLLREEEANPVYNSPVDITTIILSFSPRIGGRPVTPEDGPELFDQSLLSEYIPFIQYNDSTGKPVYKVWTGESVESEPNYKTVVISEALASAASAMYFRLWLGNPAITPLPRATKESFVNVVWFLDSNILTIEVPAYEHADGSTTSVGRQNRITALQRFGSSLPGLDLGTGTEIRVRGEFIIWNFRYLDFVLLDLILNDPLFRTYMYVEESVKPYSLKKRFDIHYKSLEGDEGSVLTVSLSPKTLDQESIRTVTSTSRTFIPGNQPDFKEVRILKDTPYVQAKIIKANSRRIVSEFLVIFRILLQQYRLESPRITALYYQILPELRNLTPVSREKKTKKKEGGRGDSKLRQLQAAAPDIFIADYARQCQQGNQPIVISESEIPAWTARRILYHGYSIDRPVIAFPANNPRIFLTCPGDANPFIGVKVNDKLSNQDRYPYIPCCYGQIQTIPGTNTNYNHYIQGLEPQRKARGTKTEIKSNKILAPGGMGYVPRAVENLLRNDPDLEGEILRFGVVRSPNSFLHCISVALDDRQYLSLRSDEERELYIQGMREYVAQVHPSLLSQELYGFSHEEIQRKLRDPAIFFDPRIFYRAVEEMYKISIYTFVPPAAGDELSLGSIEVPRHYLFHADTPHLERRTICVLKNFGSESDALEYPQCELIVDWDKPSGMARKIFGPEMNEICSQALTVALSTITWRNGKGYENLYSSIDHLKVFSSFQPVEQFVDEYGKLRALSFSHGGTRMTIMTVPSQPENLPFSTNVYPLPLPSVVQILGPYLSSATRNEKGEVIGVWVSLKGVGNLEFVPTVPATVLPEEIRVLPPGPPNPLQTSGVNISDRIRRLQRTLNLIIQLTQWLYEIYRGESPNPQVSDFTNRYLETANYQGDSSLFYSLERVPRRLPMAGTVVEGIRFLHMEAPTFARANGRLLMYNEEFGVKIAEMLRDYDHDRLGTIPSPARVLSNYYQSIDDYRPQAHVLIFLETSLLRSYLQRRARKDQYEIKSRITTSMSTSQEPFFYKTKDGNIFVIQNVLDGDLRRALTVADTWRREGRNPGFQARITFTELEPFPDTLIYTLTPSETLTLMEDRSNGKDEFYQLVNYSTSPSSKPYYAAMLLVL